MIRVVLPYHLQTLARIGREVQLAIESPATLGGVLDALEGRYPMLRGTVRDPITKERRAFIRFFICGEDWSHRLPDSLLPPEILQGAEPLRIVGAMAGG